MLVEESAECVLAVLEILRREAPHVHRYRRVRIQRCIYPILGEDDGAVLILDLRALHDVGEQTLLVGCTDTAADGSVLAEGVAYAVADHAVLSFLALYRTEEVCQHLVGLFAVEVIGIDDRKGFVDQFTSHEHSVVGTPGFGALRIIGASGRHFVHRLEAQFALHFAFVLAEYDTAKIVFEILTDNKYNLTKSCAQRVVHAVIKDCFTVRSETVHLFEPAVTTTHSGCQDK